MSNGVIEKDINLEPANNKRLANVCGPHNEHLMLLEERLNVSIKNRGNHFSIIGEQEQVANAINALQSLYLETEQNTLVSSSVHLQLQTLQMEQPVSSQPLDPVVIRARKKIIKARGSNQQSYVKSISNNDIVFGVGPAGTGKTYLAVACAVEALESEKVARIIRVQPSRQESG